MPTQTIHEELLNQNCASVEFCSQNSQNSEILVLGNYQLSNTDTISREGGILLYQISDDAKNKFQPQKLQQIDCAGVFDLTWQYSQNNLPNLLAAQSDGKFVIYRYVNDKSSKLTQENVITISDTALCTCVDWQKGKNGDRFAVSTSSGEICIVTKQNGGELVNESQSTQHDFECWCIQFDNHTHEMLYSGGDDCAFKGYDVRTGIHNPIFQNKKSHSAGVCRVVSHPSKEHVVLTGSYDENIRVWDVRNIGKPVLISGCGLQGGVWQFKFNPFNSKQIVVGCMQTGFKIIELELESLEISEVEHYQFQRSLAYAIDWSQKTEGLLASCSFYDKEFHLWQFT